jgi:hypothetical protein
MRLRRLRTLEGLLHPLRTRQWNHPMVFE